MYKHYKCLHGRYLAGEDDEDDSDEDSDDGDDDDDDNDDTEEEKESADKTLTYQKQLKQLQSTLADRLAQTRRTYETSQPMYNNRHSMPEELRKQTTNYNATTTANNEDLLVCSFPGCRKKYKTQRGLENHQRTIHK